MVSDTVRFFPITHRDVVDKIGLLSLNRWINGARDAAESAAEILQRELDAVQPAYRQAKVGRHLSGALDLVKTLPLITSAIKVVETIKACGRGSSIGTVLEGIMVIVVGCAGTDGLVGEGFCRVLQGREATIVLVDHDPGEAPQPAPAELLRGGRGQNSRGIRYLRPSAIPPSFRQQV